MSLPELRCLLCDRVLLDEATSLPSERCLRCGKLMQVGDPPAPALPPGEQAGFTPGEGSRLATTFDELPEAVPVVHPRGAPPILRPTAAGSERQVPTPPEPPLVRPIAPVPPAVAKPTWVPPVQSHPPVPPHEDQIERPKPRFGCALLVVLGFGLLAVLAVTFIVYAIARGLRKVPKTEATPAKVVAEAAPVQPIPLKVRPLDPESIPVPVRSLWGPPRGTYPVARANPSATATIPLPAASPYGVLAGSGRFVLFPLPEARLLAVFDVVTAKLAGFLPMPDPASLVAGSANEVCIVSPATRKGQRYPLDTLPEILDGRGAERTVLLNERLGEPLALAAGHSARGPIYLLASKPSGTELQLLDVETLEPIGWKPEVAPFQKPLGVFTGGTTGDRAYLRTSADGRTLVGGVAKGTQRYRADRLELFGPNPRIAPTGISLDRPAFPTADGGMTAFASNPKSTRFPMAEGSGYFEIADKAGGKVLAMTFDGGEGHLQRAEVPGLTDFAADDGPNQDRRAFLVPGARAFVHLSADGRSIHWRRVKISEELAKVPQDYLVVAGSPPSTAVRGRKFTYEPTALSNVGESYLKLDVGPPGMMVEGPAIVWRVPADYPPSEAAIELSLESKLKPKVGAKQRFTLSLLTEPLDMLIYSAPELRQWAPPRQVKAGKPDAPLAFLGEPGKTARLGRLYATTLKLGTPEDAEVAILAAPTPARWDGDTLTWAVPAGKTPFAVPVVIAAKTKSGKQVTLGYLLEVTE